MRRLPHVATLPILGGGCVGQQEGQQKSPAGRGYLKHQIKQCMNKRIDLQTTVANIAEAAKKHNAKYMPTAEYGKMVRQNHESTAIHLYKSYKEAVEGGRYPMATPQSYLANGAMIATRLGMHTPKTFDAHMVRLQAAGIAWRVVPTTYEKQIRKSVKPVHTTAGGSKIYQPKPEDLTSEIIINPSLIAYHQPETQQS